MILVTSATGNVVGELARTFAHAGQRMRAGPSSAPAVRQRSRRGWRRWPGT